MLSQADGQFGRVRRIADQHGEAADQPAVHFVQQELFAPEFGWGAGLAPSQHRGVGLEQTQDLVGRRHRLAVEDASLRLVLRAAEQRQVAIGGIVDGGLHDGAGDAQVAAVRHLSGAGELGHPLPELVQGGGLDKVGPAQQGGVIGDRLQAQATELAQHQAVVDEVLRLGIAPGVQVQDHQQARDDLDRRGRAARGGGVGTAAAQVDFHLLEQLIVFQQVVQLSQLGFAVQVQRRHQVERVDGVVPVS